MFNLGVNKVGQYDVFVSPNNDFYYEVFITREAEFLFYVNPVKEILKLDFSERNPLYAKAFPPKRNKEDEEYPPLSLEEKEFMEEYNSYKHRKEMIMPIWKLSKRHVEELFSLLENK